MEHQTLLHRQVNPKFVQNNIVSVQAFTEQVTVVTSQTFLPTPKDEGKLSVYNGAKFTPQQSYEHFTQNFLSAGVLSVTKEECESLPPLTVTEDNNPFDGHTYIDFTSVSATGARKAKAGKLRDFAVSRGWTFVKEN